jgi:hypothetical protein
MSNLYDDASLIMFPSGYKEDKIYSLKPTDGSGDLTFTRASAATRVNAEGLIETASVIGSEEVTDGNFPSGTTAWSFGGGWSLGVGVAEANGSTSTSNLLTQDLGLVATKTYTISFSSNRVGGTLFVKNGTLYSSGTIYTLNTGTGLEVQTFTVTSPSSSAIGFYAYNYEGTIDNVSVKEVITNNVPRIDYTSGCGKLLLEPQRTNIALRSEEFSNASSWVLANSGTITANTTISPDGTQTADTLNAGANSAQVQQHRTDTSGAVYTVSIWVKRITGTGNVFLRAVVNADTLIAVTSDWQRFTATVTSTTTTIRIGVKLATSGDAVAIWGGQVELGSYATSYIPTTTTAVTRLADAASKTGISSLINSTEGVLYGEIAALYDDGTNRGIAISDGTSSNRVYVSYTTTTNQITGVYTYSGTTQVSINETLTDSTQFIKFAFKYKENDCAFWVNGIEVGTDNTATEFAADTLDTLNFDSGAGGSIFYGKCQNLMVFPSALTDTELATLTTL